MMVALGSVKGAPGVTTTALALASVWPLDCSVLLAEVDPDGGVLAARRDLALEPGLATLAAALRRGGAAVSPHAQEIGDRVRAVVAPPSADQTRAALGVAGERLWQALAGMDDDVIVDCGRLPSSSPVAGVLAHADLTVLAARPRLDDVALLRERLASLHRGRTDARVLLIGDGPYTPSEVGAVLEQPTPWTLPADRRTAAALDGPSGRPPSSRAPLMRAARQLAGALRFVVGGPVRVGT